MNIFQKNVVANYMGKVWSVFSVYFFLPMYIKFLGIESYGIIGFYAILQGVLAFADVGLTATLNRELSWRSACSESAQGMRNLVRTLEYIYFGIVTVMIVAIVYFAPMIARYGMNASNVPIEVVENTIRLMGPTLALQFLSGLHVGGLMGLQRQALANYILVGMGFLKSAGSVLVLWMISPTIYAFFIWQLLINAGLATMVAISLWRCLPRDSTIPQFQVSLLQEIWRYAAGMTSISIISAILNQMDKVTVSKLLSLEALGYYSLASIVGQVPILIIQPITNAILPRFTQMAKENQQRKLANFYHTVCQFTAVVVFPVSFYVAVFSQKIIIIWTRSSIVASNAYMSASLLVIGGLFLALLVPPFTLALAHAYTRLNVNLGISSIVVMVPLLIALTQQYDLIGASIAWIILNGGMFFIYIPILHKRLLPGENKYWFLHDILIPCVISLATAYIGWLVIPSNFSSIIFAIVFCFMVTISIMCVSLVCPKTRSLVISFFQRIFLKKTD